MYESGRCFGLAELGWLHGWTLLSAVDHWMRCAVMEPMGLGKTKHSVFCPSPFKRICCNGAPRAGSFHSDVCAMLGSPQATQATTPAKLKLSPSKDETSMAWAESPLVYAENLLPALLRRYFVEVWTLLFWVINSTKRLAPKPSTAD